MKTSAEELFGNMNRLYQNTVSLLKGFSDATNTNQSSISVNLIDENGQVQTLQINSFQRLLSEISRIDSNFDSLTNTDNISYIVNSDGSIGQVTKTSFINAEYLSGFTFPGNQTDVNDVDGSECIIDTKSLFKNMVFPNVKIPIQINTAVRSDVRCLMYDVTSGWEDIESEIDLIQLKFMLTQGTVTANVEEFTLGLEKEQVKYFGKFTVVNSNTVGNVSTIELSEIKYQGINTVGDSINLKVGDLLVNKTGTAKFQINEIDLFTKILKVTKVSGIGTVATGVDSLYFNEVVDTETNIVGVPVQPNKKLLIFLSTENLKTVSYPSKAIKLDTETFSVSNQEGTFTLDEYFNKYVTNISEYLYSLIRETTVPISLGITPNVPTLNAANFKVVQINKHLTDAKSTKDLETLNASKQNIKNNIDFKKTEISKVQNELDTAKFKTIEEKNFRLNKIITLRQEVNSLEANLLTVTRELDNNAITYGLKNVKPKFRVLGMWDIQNPIYSPKTKPQNIIKFDVQYRYLSKNIDTIESTTYKMINNEGKEISVVVSPWNQLDTRTLNKVSNVDGSLSWETPILDSVDDININQLNIAINEGESIEMRVRAISEAGYPISPLKSEWSEILRVDFPNNLTEASLNTIVAKNEEDLKKSELNEILMSSGIIDHVSGQITEAEKIYRHKASEIASGFFTAEQKNIDVQSFLQTLRNDINQLINGNTQDNVLIQVIDFNNESYTVVNNSQIDISAGNYSDSINLLDATKFGSIIRKKGYIKIKNSNLLPIEIKTLVPGVNFDADNAAKYYNVPVKTPTALVQNSKQIIYFRNVDITGQNEDIFMLVKPRVGDTNTFPNPIYLDGAATEDSKNLVYFDNVTPNSVVQVGKLLPNANTDFLGFSKEHPMFDSENMDNMLPEFERLKLYSKTLKAETYQEEPITSDNEHLLMGVGFTDTDFYAVGDNSCGAFLYPVISNVNAVSVVGNNTISSLIIPSNTEILIPFVYEYRMIDRFGNINGKKETTINDVITYNKKLGIDMLINNQIFKFDINVTSRLKSTIIPIESLNVTSVVGQFNSEDPEIINP